MGFLTRRKLILMGLGAGIIARVNDEYNRDRNFNLQRQAIDDALVDNPEDIIDTAYSMESDWETEIAQRIVQRRHRTPVFVGFAIATKSVLKYLITKI